MNKELKDRFEAIIENYDFIESLKSEDDTTGMAAFLDLMHSAYELGQSSLKSRVEELEGGVSIDDLKTLMKFIGIPDYQFNKLHELIKALPSKAK